MLSGKKSLMQKFSPLLNWQRPIWVFNQGAPYWVRSVLSVQGRIPH
jgi:hypothetical protein